MAFGLWRFLCGCMVILFCSFGMLTPALAADDAPLLADSAEYAVMMAVLFPNVITSYSIHYTKLYDGATARPVPGHWAWNNGYR